VSATVPEAHLVPIRAAAEVVRPRVVAGIEYVVAATTVEGVTVVARLFLAVVDPVLLPVQAVPARATLQPVGTGSTADQVVAAPAVDDIVAASGDDHVAVRRSDDGVAVSGADDGGFHAVAGRAGSGCGTGHQHHRRDHEEESTEGLHARSDAGRLDSVRQDEEFVGDRP